MASSNESIDPRVLKRYDATQKIGQGAYGVVWKAVNRKDGKDGSAQEVL